MVECRMSQPTRAKPMPLHLSRGGKPDALVVDYYLHPGNREAENGLDLALRLRTSGPCVLKVLIVTDHHAVG